LILWAVLASALVALAYGYCLVRKVLREDPGSAKMREIAAAIEEGAMAYLERQFRTMIVSVRAITFLLYILYRDLYVQPSLPIRIALAFLMGVLASYGAGYVGMWLAVKGNVRTANKALASFAKSLKLDFQAGAVSGMFAEGFGLLGATTIFLILQGVAPTSTAK
jgi:K(+)-stimulated pyrophosphate-energized sodium pump